MPWPFNLPETARTIGEAANEATDNAGRHAVNATEVAAQHGERAAEHLGEEAAHRLAQPFHEGIARVSTQCGFGSSR